MKRVLVVVLLFGLCLSWAKDTQETEEERRHHHHRHHHNHKLKHATRFHDMQPDQEEDAFRVAHRDEDGASSSTADVGGGGGGGTVTSTAGGGGGGTGGTTGTTGGATGGTTGTGGATAQTTGTGGASTGSSGGTGSTGGTGATGATGAMDLTYCYTVNVDTAFTTIGDACGAVNVSFPLGSVLSSQDPTPISTPSCSLDVCSTANGACNSWLSIIDNGNIEFNVLYVPSSFLTPTSCVLPEAASATAPDNIATGPSSFQEATSFPPDTAPANIPDDPTDITGAQNPNLGGTAGLSGVTANSNTGGASNGNTNTGGNGNGVTGGNNANPPAANPAQLFFEAQGLLDHFKSLAPSERPAPELIERARHILHVIQHRSHDDDDDDIFIFPFDWNQIMLWFAALSGVQPPTEWHPLPLSQGDGMCYVPLMDTDLLMDACGKKIATIPKNTVLTPLYGYKQIDTCKEMSIDSIENQKGRWERNEAKRKEKEGAKYVPAGFVPTLPYRLDWYTNVTFGSPPQVGWVSIDRVNKELCSQAQASCAFTAVNPQTCFRVTIGSKSILNAPCGTALASPNGQALQHDILVTADGTAAATPSGCKGNWLHVTFNDVEGYTTDSGTTSFACNGDGWLKMVGPFTVIRDDKSRLASTGPHNTAPNKFLVHTIEGAWPRYGDYPNSALNDHKSWPQFLVARQADGHVVVVQYYSIYSWGRSLVSRNPDGVVQVETGAKAANPFTEHDWVIALTVRELYHSVAAITGIPLCKDSRVNFRQLGVPDADVRLTPTVWADVHGLVGHQHNPQPDPPPKGSKEKQKYETHWDPGHIDPFKLTN